jgi:hypothetical protein
MIPLFCVNFITFMEIRIEAGHLQFDWLLVHWKKDTLICSYVGLNLVLKRKDDPFFYHCGAA